MIKGQQGRSTLEDLFPGFQKRKEGIRLDRGLRENQGPRDSSEVGDTRIADYCIWERGGFAVAKEKREPT